MVQVDVSDILGTSETEKSTGLQVDISDLVSETGDGNLYPDYVNDMDSGNEFTNAIQRGWNNIQAISGDALEAYGEFFDLPDAVAYGRGVSKKK